MLAEEVSAPRRLAQVGASVLFCFCISGLVFGFAALKPVLLSSGVYADLCPPDESPCSIQDTRLNLLFIAATCTTNAASLPMGSFLDRAGPRTASILGAAVFAVGCIVFGIGFVGPYMDTYLLGFMLMALGAPAFTLSQFHLSNAFPARSGLILGAITGAFDASSLPFVLYKSAYFALGEAPSLRVFFSGYALIPVAIIAQQLSYGPEDVYERPLEAVAIDAGLGEVEEESESEDELGVGGVGGGAGASDWRDFTMRTAPAAPGETAPLRIDSGREREGERTRYGAISRSYEPDTRGPLHGHMSRSPDLAPDARYDDVPTRPTAPRRATHHSNPHAHSPPPQAPSAAARILTRRRSSAWSHISFDPSGHALPPPGAGVRRRRASSSTTYSRVAFGIPDDADAAEALELVEERVRKGHPGVKDVVVGALYGRSAREQVGSSWFGVLEVMIVVHMINWYLATVNTQLVYYTRDEALAAKLTDAFTLLLPLAGILCVPAIGWLLDTRTTRDISVVMLVMGALFGVLTLSGSTVAQLVGIVVVVSFRPLFYTAISDYCAKVFGFDTFGSVYGLAMTLSGLFGLLLNPLDVMLKGPLGGNYTVVNIVFLVAGLIAAAALVVRTGRGERGEVAWVDGGGGGEVEE